METHLARPRVGACTVTWKEYQLLLRAFAEHPGVRMAYDRGRLEILNHELGHCRDAELLSAVVLFLTMELGRSYRGGGSTTLHCRRRRRGIDPDKCFWIDNAPALAGVTALDLDVHPPPDLVLEIETDHEWVNRLGIYRALGGPEVWSLRRDVLRFRTLGPTGRYEQPGVSRSFPGVTPADIMPFLLEDRAAGNQIPVRNRIRAWARERAAE